MLHKVGSLGNLDKKLMVGVEVEQKHILISHLDGTFYAIGNECTHRHCKLSDGTIVGETVRCPCHGSVFNLKTGEVIRGVAKNSEPHYLIKIENDEIFIEW